MRRVCSVLGIALSLMVALVSCGPKERAAREIPELSLPTAQDREADAALTDAQRLFASGDEKLAEPLLWRVLELRPDDVDARVLLADVLINRKRPNAAVDHLRLALEKDPEYVRAHELLAETLFGLGDLPAAIDAYSAWGKAAPRDADAYFGLGQAMYASDNHVGALQALRYAERIRQGRADVRSELGLVLQAMERLDEAEQKQRDAIERDPRFALAWFRLGDVVSRGGPERRAEAIECLTKAVRLDARLVHGHLYLFRLLMLSPGGLDDAAAKQARQSWAAVLAYHEQEQLVHHAMGEKPKRIPDVEEEEERLRAAVDAGPEPAVDARFALGRLLHGQGRLADALALYRAVLAADAAHAEARALAGAVLLLHREFPEAEQQLRKAVRLAPDAPAPQRNLAWLLLRTGRSEEAADAYARVLELVPGDVRARKGQGLAWMKMGHLDEGLHQIAAAGWLER